VSGLRQLWARRRTHPWFVVCAAVVLASLLVYPAVDWYLRAADAAAAFRFWDFGAYGGAVNRWTAGEPIYVPDDDGPGYHGSYLYPPVFLLLFAPFVALPPGTGAVAWGVCTVAFLWLGMQALAAALGGDLHPVERALLLAALVGFQPLLLSVKLGQASAFVGGLVAVAGAALVVGERAGGTRRTGRVGRLGRWTSGAATAIAGTLKLAYAPVGAHLLARRDRLVGAVAAGIGLVALSVAVFGVEAHLTYLDVLRWGVTLGGRTRPPTLWLAPYFAPLFALPVDTLPVRLAGALGVAVLAAGSAADREVFALGVAATPLLAPQAYTYTFVALLPAVAVLVATEFDRDGCPAVPVAALGLLHVHAHGLRLVGEAVPPLVGGSAPVVVSLLQPGLWGVLALAGLAAVRAVEDATVPTLRPGERSFPWSRS
jgi:hypothetical protein